jgi:hypothetical protein
MDVAKEYMRGVTMDSRGGPPARRRARSKERTPGIALIPSTKLMFETCRGGSEYARATVCAR